MNGTNSILPSGENLNSLPTEVLRYLDVNGLRSVLRQERLRWNLKVNKDMDYYDRSKNWKYTSDVHNEAYYQRMEIRSYPDNGCIEGYAGLNNDSGQFGLVHDVDKWDYSMSNESKETIVNRTQIGACAKIPGKTGYGVDNTGTVNESTINRQSSILFDPYDGRAYLLTNDSPLYVNNASRTDKIPLRAIARIGDIPTSITDLVNDQNFISDPTYHHTDNNFNNSNRYIVDNIDDRTFVYPEISKDSNGNYIPNIRFALDGSNKYGESDSNQSANTHYDRDNDRQDANVNSISANKNFSGVTHNSGYFPGIFRSLEELEKVDLVHQRRSLLNNEQTPGIKRKYNYYLLDGVWLTEDSYKQPNLVPSNMEDESNNAQPTPVNRSSNLYQWRYNRVTLKYFSDNIRLNIVNGGRGYEVGDILRWSFVNDVLYYRVDQVSDSGKILDGSYVLSSSLIFHQSPSTNGIGVAFVNTTGTGNGATISIDARPTVENYASQIKNNLYAYVDVVPSVRSDINSPWSDNVIPSTQEGLITVRSTAAAPAYSGINTGRGGPEASESCLFYEHGGNPTAGVHLHLFHYVIDTLNPTYVEVDGVKVYTGKWVDMGPMGVERPCDIKALLLSNPDTNCFNNYYKFSMDTLLDEGSPDSDVTNNSNSVSHSYIHVDRIDPISNRRFTEKRINPTTGEVEDVDITDRVIYINAADNKMFIYNSSEKSSGGSITNGIGWIQILGSSI